MFTRKSKIIYSSVITLQENQHFKPLILRNWVQNIINVYDWTIIDSRRLILRYAKPYWKWKSTNRLNDLLKTVSACISWNKLQRVYIVKIKMKKKLISLLYTNQSTSSRLTSLSELDCQKMPFFFRPSLSLVSKCSESKIGLFKHS